MNQKPIRFNVEEANNCGWTFNCGPGAIAAVMGLTPAELRPHMGDFERKGYTNPTLMYQILRRIGAGHRQVYRSDQPAPLPKLNFGLIRIQWGGPWTKPGVPMAARYRQTHWIAASNQSGTIFDINATCCGGWMPLDEWHSKLVPWLCKEVVRGWDGTYWPTHAIEISTAPG